MNTFSPPIKPAATLLLARDSADGPQLLLLRRSESLSFAAGHWVFPGGSIDQGDFLDASSPLRSPQECACDRPGGEFFAAQRAAIRETREEAGLNVDCDSLLYYSHWIAPPLMKKRFSTWFFISPAGAAPTEKVLVDGGEIDCARWLSPRQALQEIFDQKIAVLPPTRVTLIELASCASVDEMLSLCRRRAPPVFRPRTYIGQQCRPDSGDERFVFFYHGDAGYGDADPDIPGARHRLSLLDGQWHYEKTVEVLP